MTGTTDREVCVVGGGPAGAVIARRLAQLGHDTVLIDRNTPPQQPRAELLAPSILPLLTSLGIEDCAERAVFCRETHTLIRWNADTVEEKDSGTSSLLIERSRFDAQLRNAARDAGAHIIPLAARPPQRRSSGGWTVPLAGSARAITCAFLVDARGKRFGGRIKTSQPRTIAICGNWRIRSHSFAQMRIEACAEEWIWGSPVGEDRYAAAIFVDASRAAGLGRKERKELYLRLLSRSHLHNGLLAGELIATPTARDASSTTAENLIGADFIKVGEAAHAIDPLSSQGIQSAILSAAQGSAAVHTILAGHGTTPPMEFYTSSQLRAAARAAQNAAALYRARAEISPSAFWRERSADRLQSPQRTKRESAGSRSLPACIRWSGALRIVDAPVIAGALIKRAPVLSHPDLDEPVGYLGGVGAGATRCGCARPAIHRGNTCHLGATNRPDARAQYPDLDAQRRYCRIFRRSIPGFIPRRQGTGRAWRDRLTVPCWRSDARSRRDP